MVNPGVGMLEKEICLPGEKDNSMPGELNEVRNYSFKNMTDKKLPPVYECSEIPSRMLIQ